MRTITSDMDLANNALRAALNWLSPSGPGARLSVVLFHRVLAAPDPLFPDDIDQTCFRKICDWLATWFTVLPLDQALRQQADGCLPARALSITFDDGYADNAEVALPILQQHGLPATFFVATGFLNGGRMFNDTVIECVRSTSCEELDLDGFALGRREVRSLSQRRSVIDDLLPKLKHLQLKERQTALASLLERAKQPSLPADLMMRSAQVQALHGAGMEIGGHTVNHPILHVLCDADAEWEIAQGRQQLESLVQAPVACFAYPNGRPTKDYGARDVALVRRLGFLGAVSTATGVVKADADPFQLPRFTPWDAGTSRWLARLAMMRVRSAPATVA